MARSITRFFRTKAKVIAQQLQYWLKWCCLSVSKHAGFKDPDALCSTTFCKFKTQPAFADAGLADHTNNPTFTSDSVFELNEKSGTLARPPGKRAQAPS